MGSLSLRRVAIVLSAGVAAIAAIGLAYDPDPGPLRLSRRTEVVDGTRLSFHQAGAGPDVVLLHGGMGSAEDFETVLPLLAGSHRVTAVDRPGFGLSLARGDDATFPGNARLVAGLIRRLGLRRPVIVGHSHGGGVALQIAADDPALPAGLVLVAAAAYPGGKGSGALNHVLASPAFGPGLAALVGPAMAPRTIRRTLEEGLGPDLGKVPANFIEERIRLWNNPRSLAAHARQQVTDGAGLAALSARYPRIDVPAVALDCDQDPYQGASVDTHRLAKDLPHAREVVLTGCGHYVQYARPDAVVDAVLALESQAN